MCQNCNYKNLLERAGLDATRNRLHVLEVIGNNHYPLTAADVYKTVERSHPVNRVTVYRILDLLVQRRIVERLSTGGRAAHFGLAPNEYHQAHPHFYCTHCGQMDCLSPESLDITSENLEKTFSGEIGRIEIRVDGICRTCLKRNDC
ncbi:MAG: transcriptional repressor [Desulfocapsaceae bacterium]